MKLEWSIKNLFKRKEQTLFPNVAQYVDGKVVWNEDNLRSYTTAYTTNAGLYSIVKRIGKTAAIAPFKVYRVKDKRNLAKYKSWTGENATPESLQKAMVLKAKVFEEDNNHKLNVLIENPNQLQGGNEFTENSIGFKLLTGNRFLFVDRLPGGGDAGKPFELYNLPPQHMRIKGAGPLMEIAGYTLNISTEKQLEKDSIIHSRYWNPRFDDSHSHLWGLSPLKAAQRNLTRTDSALERSVAMLQNAGAAGVLFSKGERESLTPEQAGALKLKVNTEVLGFKNAGKVVVANGDLGYISLGLTAIEMSILEMEKWSIEQLCNIYQVPPGLFMSSANATDNNIQGWNKQLITQAVIPELASLRDDWNVIAKMYKEEIYIDYDLTFFPELQEDLAKTADVMNKAWWYTPNEKRLAMGADEDGLEPMMNSYLIPSGLTPLQDLNIGSIEDIE